MKICAVGLRGMPGVMGGVEKHCEQLYRRIVELDDDIEVVVIARKAYMNQKASAAPIRGVKVVPLWCLRNKYLEAVLHTFMAVLYARFAVRADVVHIHAIGPGLFAPLARLLGMQVLVTHHGAAYHAAKWNRFARWCLRIGERLALRWAHTMVVVSASLFVKLKQDYPAYARKLVYIPNGAEAIRREVPGMPVHPVLAQFDLSPGSYIVTVGRFVPEKGFQDLIDAYRLADTDKTLVIVGAADHPDTFSRHLLQQQQADIVFTGFQTGEALAALLCNSALFVLPSHMEGLPIAALEALSAGCPVLLSDIEPNRDIRLPERCYFPVRNVAALAQRLSMPDYQMMRVDAEAVLTRFNWDIIAQQTLHCLRNILRPTQSQFTIKEEARER